jgi:hypothetical protein
MKKPAKRFAGFLFEYNFVLVTSLLNTLRLLSYFPTIPLVLILCTGLYGITYYEEVPVYSVHPDPTSLGISWVMQLMAIPAFICFVSIPATLILCIHLLINRVSFRRSDKISLLVFALSLLLLILLINDDSGFFAWVMD